jgi:hypothetical protein
MGFYKTVVNLLLDSGYFIIFNKRRNKIRSFLGVFPSEEGIMVD